MPTEEKTREDTFVFALENEKFDNFVKQLSEIVGVPSGTNTKYNTFPGFCFPHAVLTLLEYLPRHAILQKELNELLECISNPNLNNNFFVE